MTLITQLQAENVKRIKAVTIDPKGSVVVIGGKNGQGKTSVLDSIMYALGGKETLPAQPLRKGQANGKIVVKLTDGMTITRRFTRKGESDSTTALEVRGPAGETLSSPQALLDKLCSRVAFDPLAFSRLKPKDQADELKALVGLNFDELDAQREVAYSSRTDLHRQIKQAEAELIGIDQVEGVPLAEVSVAGLTDKLAAAEKRNKLNEGDRSTLAAQQARVKSYENERDRLKAELERVERSLADEIKTRDEMATAVEQLKDSDTAALRQQIKDAETTNKGVRQNARRLALSSVAETIKQKALALTEKIDGIDKAKADAMQGAKYPVAGLSFNAEGVTMDGLPFSQASSAQQLRVSIAIGFALNPGLPIALIRDGSLLDSDSLALAAQITDEHKGQLWIERVGAGDEVTVLIEDGQVAESV